MVFFKGWKGVKWRTGSLITEVLIALLKLQTGIVWNQNATIKIAKWFG
jgi:hypothetical protein